MPRAGQHGSSGLGDAPRSDAAEFFGELLLELQAHVGRAAQRVRLLVQRHPRKDAAGTLCRELPGLAARPATGVVDSQNLLWSCLGAENLPLRKIFQVAVTPLNQL